jgi:hypothetical protein
VTSRAGAALATVLAGSIALMSLLTLVVEQDDGGGTTEIVTSGNIQLPVESWPKLESSLAEVPGIETLSISADISASTDSSQFVSVVVANCTTVNAVTGADDCVDGAVYAEFQRPPAERATTVQVNAGSDGATVAWTPRDVITMPGTTPPDPSFAVDRYLLTTGAYLAQIGPSAATPFAYVAISMDPASVDAAQRAISWLGVDAASVFGIYNRIDAETVGWLRAGLVASGLLVLGICVLGLWLLAVEQIRERRRAFSLARAAGVPMRTLGGSVLLESLAPVVVAVPLAVVIGSVLGWLIQVLLVDSGDGFRVDWDWALGASLVALAVTALTAWAAALRLKAATGPAAMRTE